MQKTTYTYQELIQNLPKYLQEKIRQQLKERAGRVTFYDLKDLLTLGFGWTNSKQGYLYWSCLYDQLTAGISPSDITNPAFLDKTDKRFKGNRSY